MKVYIGPYKKYYGPYQVTDFLARWFKLSDERHDALIAWLEKYTPLTMICKWFENRERVIKVKIHDYDTWNADGTLALIILPVLKRVKELKQGTPCEMFCEEYFQISSSEEYFNEGSFGPLHVRISALEQEAIQRWNDTLDKMILSFSRVLDDANGEPTDIHELKKYWAEIDEGLLLFGKHYRNLWS